MNFQERAHTGEAAAWYTVYTTPTLYLYPVSLGTRDIHPSASFDSDLPRHHLQQLHQQAPHQCISFRSLANQPSTLVAGQKDILLRQAFRTAPVSSLASI
mmetsp:Transcript_93485/g.161956  ORF Transcript_93485/g.161956 Transcript_93485/m.161956 type:complete len:100 (+) Transcript_93485:1469-1768(+)